VELSVTEPRPADASGPRAEYTRRLEARRAEAARLDRLQDLVGISRVVVFVAAVLLAWLAFGADLLAPAWLAVPAVLFLTLLIRYDRVTRALRKARRAAAFYEKGLARLDERWSGAGEPGTRFLDPEHPFALDLDLFGTGSVFELLCTARTRAGQDALAGWLLSPAEPEEVRERQAAVAELRPGLDLREDIALLGAGVQAGVDLEALVKWGAAPPALVPRGARLTARVLAALAVLALAAWLIPGVGLAPFLAVVVLQIGYTLWIGPRAQRVLAPVERRTHDLVLLAGVLARLENEPFTSPRLARLRAALETGGLPPSRRVAQLVFLIDWLNARRNQFFMPLAFILLWPAQFAFAIEAWRTAWGSAIERWLAAVAEFEALCALAAYAYEHPADPFPEVVAEGPCFEGEGLGHPLIPEARCVRNDVSLGGELRVLVVSGSNMSGKSTLLRTVGVNAVLALAGAPVRARRLRVSPLVAGATLRIQDSLQAGRSRFYAEITRVRQLIDLSRGRRPLLFLLDEVFHGTNSHDRRLGAEAVVRTLADNGAVGLITTHDLALTHIAEQLAPHAANVHFEDHFENGAITFDYRMRPGVVQKSNALALMRAVGIEV
jgi:hypothetical protein